MEADAETLFDYLGKRYEDAFADSPNLHRFISQAAKRLPAQSKVLDVGCGTGKPVAQVLQFAGHDVHGIDISQEMVNIASSQVKGQFQKADMRKYQPSSPFDGIFVILSLFQITPGETYSMAFKWSEWLKRDGILAIGVTPSTSLPADECTYDATWDCSRQIGKPWMDKYTNETFFSEDRWQEILRCAGFEIETSVTYSFTPNDPEHQSAETHYLVLARKVEAQPLLGPYSLSSYSLPSENSTQVDVSPHNFFSSRLVSEDLKKLLNALRTDQRVISLGSLPQGGYSQNPGFQFYDGSIESLPFSSGVFDVVLAPWRLGYVSDVEAAIREMVRVAKRASQSRILIIQGAPDSEVVQLLNTTSCLSPVSHQGNLLRSVMQQLEMEGFGNMNLQRAHAHYSFPEEAIAKRCNSAATVLLNGSHCLNNQEELMSRLQLHFQGCGDRIGHDMVILSASPI